MSHPTELNMLVAAIGQNQLEMLNPSTLEVFRQSVAYMAVHLASVTGKDVSFRLGFDGHEDENATKVEWT